ncbi:tetratricopeptide repeat protein [Kordia sp.]|uniref:tetratricopeptide repeat protein n=1 Tax=Kordia sp. TaxID=1965332 RepID=UPI003B5BA481
MNDLTEQSNNQFWKKIALIIGIGIVLLAVVYFGKEYKTSQKVAETTKFYDQFSDEKYIEFAKKLEASIHTENPKIFDKSIDVASFFNFSARELAESYNKRTAIAFLQPYLKLGGSISAQLTYPSDFKFTKFYKKDGVPHIVFRLYRSDFINFMDFTLGIKEDTIVVTNMYNFYSGIVFSEMISEMYYESINQSQQFISELKTYQQVNSYIQSGSYEEAYNLLVSIPVEKRNPLHNQYVLASAADFDADRFIEIIKNIKKEKPDDERLHVYLNLLETIFLADIDKLNKAINELKKYVGEDAIFDVYRGLLYNLQSDYDKAIPFFDRLITQSPEFHDGYIYKLYTLLTQNKTDEALVLVTKIKERLSMSEENLTFQISEFQTFINSEAYKNIFKSAE